jgi:hypothetical protein
MLASIPDPPVRRWELEGARRESEWIADRIREGCFHSAVVPRLGRLTLAQRALIWAAIEGELDD